MGFIHNRPKLRKFTSLFVVLALVISSFIYYTPEVKAISSLELINKPLNSVLAVTKVSPSDKPEHLPVVRGLAFNPSQPFSFTFYLDPLGSGKAKTKDIQRLIKYFLGFLAIPDNNLWVNLSPYEGNRIIDDSLAGLDIGKDMLIEDYLLKSLTASLTDPKTAQGKRFWQEVNRMSTMVAKTTNIPLGMFNKVWIMPDKALVYEYYGQENKEIPEIKYYAFVKEARLKVLIEEDYLCLREDFKKKELSTKKKNLVEEVNKRAKEIFKKDIIPIIEREVNQGETFAPLRQLYYDLILAAYFKDKFRNHIVHKHYIDQNKAGPIAIENKQVIVDNVYKSYVESFKKGVYNYLKTDFDPYLGKNLTRRLTSGGLEMIGISKTVATESRGSVENVAKDLPGKRVEAVNWRSEQTNTDQSTGKIQSYNADFFLISSGLVILSGLSFLIYNLYKYFQGKFFSSKTASRIFIEDITKKTTNELENQIFQDCQRFIEARDKVGLKVYCRDILIAYQRGQFISRDIRYQRKVVVLMDTIYNINQILYITGNNDWPELISLLRDIIKEEIENQDKRQLGSQLSIVMDRIKTEFRKYRHNRPNDNESIKGDSYKPKHLISFLKIVFNNLDGLKCQDMALSELCRLDIAGQYSLFQILDWLDSKSFEDIDIFKSNFKGEFYSEFNDNKNQDISTRASDLLENIFKPKGIYDLVFTSRNISDNKRTELALSLEKIAKRAFSLQKRYTQTDLYFFFLNVYSGTFYFNGLNNVINEINLLDVESINLENKNKVLIAIDKLKAAHRVIRQLDAKKYRPEILEIIKVMDYLYSILNRFTVAENNNLINKSQEKIKTIDKGIVTIEREENRVRQKFVVESALALGRYYRLNSKLDQALEKYDLAVESFEYISEISQELLDSLANELTLFLNKNEGKESALQMSERIKRLQEERKIRSEKFENLISSYTDINLDRVRSILKENKTSDKWPFTEAVAKLKFEDSLDQDSQESARGNIKEVLLTIYGRYCINGKLFTQGIRDLLLQYFTGVEGNGLDDALLELLRLIFLKIEDKYPDKQKQKEEKIAVLRDFANIGLFILSNQQYQDRYSITEEKLNVAQQRFSAFISKNIAANEQFAIQILPNLISTIINKNYQGKLDSVLYELLKKWSNNIKLFNNIILVVVRKLYSSLIGPGEKFNNISKQKVFNLLFNVLNICKNSKNYNIGYKNSWLYIIAFLQDPLAVPLKTDKEIDKPALAIILNQWFKNNQLPVIDINLSKNSWFLENIKAFYSNLEMVEKEQYEAPVKDRKNMLSLWSQAVLRFLSVLRSRNVKSFIYFEDKEQMAYEYEYRNKDNTKGRNTISRLLKEDYPWDQKKTSMGEMFNTARNLYEAGYDYQTAQRRFENIIAAGSEASVYYKEACIYHEIKVPIKQKILEERINFSYVAKEFNPSKLTFGINVVEYFMESIKEFYYYPGDIGQDLLPHAEIIKKLRDDQVLFVNPINNRQRELNDETERDLFNYWQIKSLLDVQIDKIDETNREKLLEKLFFFYDRNFKKFMIKYLGVKEYADLKYGVENKIKELTGIIKNPDIAKRTISSILNNIPAGNSDIQAKLILSILNNLTKKQRIDILNSLMPYYSFKAIETRLVAEGVSPEAITQYALDDWQQGRLLALFEHIYSKIESKPLEITSLGEGAEGGVYKVTFPTAKGGEKAIVFKSYQNSSLNNNLPEAFYRESEALKKVNNIENFKGRIPKIIIKYSTKESSTRNDYAILAMDYVETDSQASSAKKLIDRITKEMSLGAVKISLAKRLDLILQLLDILKNMAQNNILHNDIKPDNCFFTPDMDKLILGDFGQTYLPELFQSKPQLYDESSSFINGVGTPAYNTINTGYLFDNYSKDLFGFLMTAMALIWGEGLENDRETIKVGLATLGGRLSAAGMGGTFSISGLEHINKIKNRGILTENEYKELDRFAAHDITNIMNSLRSLFYYSLAAYSQEATKDFAERDKAPNMDELYKKIFAIRQDKQDKQEMISIYDALKEQIVSIKRVLAVASGEENINSENKLEILEKANKSGVGYNKFIDYEGSTLPKRLEDSDPALVAIKTAGKFKQLGTNKIIQLDQAAIIDFGNRPENNLSDRLARLGVDANSAYYMGKSLEFASGQVNIVYAPSSLLGNDPAVRFTDQAGKIYLAFNLDVLALAKQRGYNIETFIKERIVPHERLEDSIRKQALDNSTIEGQVFSLVNEKFGWDIDRFAHFVTVKGEIARFLVQNQGRVSGLTPQQAFLYEIMSNETKAEILNEDEAKRSEHDEILGILIEKGIISGQLALPKQAFQDYDRNLRNQIEQSVKASAKENTGGIDISRQYLNLETVTKSKQTKDALPVGMASEKTLNDSLPSGLANQIDWQNFKGWDFKILSVSDPKPIEKILA